MNWVAYYCFVRRATGGKTFRFLPPNVSHRAAEIDICRDVGTVCEMSSNKISDKYQNEGKVNGLSAFSDKSLAPLNGRYRSKSLSSDKLNQTNADRAAILEDVEDQHMSEKSETPGCLVNGIMDKGVQVKNG